MVATSTVVPVLVASMVVLDVKVLRGVDIDSDVLVVVDVVPADEAVLVMLDSAEVQNELGDSDVNNVSGDQELMGMAVSASQVVHVTPLVLAGGRHSSGSTVAS